ncbi:MAG: tyrosine-type recombinase/integrase [Armatimonadetes bacterium]|nr:tyrosine-type recombinase/integrase [Armatimonadota bacterium]
MPRVAKAGKNRWKLRGITYGYVAPRNGYAVMHGPGRIAKALGREFIPENKEWALEQLAVWLGLRAKAIEQVAHRTALEVVPEFEKLTGLHQETKWVRALTNRALQLYLFKDCPLTVAAIEERISTIHGTSGLRGSTLRKRAQYFEKFLKWCVRKEYLERSPFATIRLPKAEYKGFAAFTEEEVYTLRDHLIKTNRRVYGLAVWFLYLTGMRSGELVLMEREHVADDSFLIIGKGANGQAKRLRHFPLLDGDRVLFPEIVQILSEVQKTTYLHRSRFVWPWTSNGPLQREFRNACEECNIWITRTDPDGQRYKRTVHSLRGSCEKRWELLGFSDMVIEDLSGHSGRIRRKHYREATPAAADLAARISRTT